MPEEARETSDAAATVDGPARAQDAPASDDPRSLAIHDDGTAPRGPPVFLVLALLALLGATIIAWRYLAAIVLAMTLAYLLHPLYARLERVLPRKGPAALVVSLLVAVLIFGPLVWLALLFVDDVARIVRSIEGRDDIEQRVSGLLESLGVPESRVDDLGARIVEEAAQYLQAAVVPLATLATEMLVSFVVFFILLFFLLKDGQAFVDYLAHVLPAPEADVRRMLGRVGGRVKAIVYGTIMVSFVQGILGGIGWWVLGLPAPIFWGVMILVLSLIPVLGAFIIFIPAAIWSFAQGNVFTGVALLVLNFALVGLVDDALRPILIGHRSGVHPGLILIGVVGGLFVFGLIGFILGPLVMSLVAPLFQAWSRPEDEPVSPVRRKRLLRRWRRART